ncbi:MAG: 4Fe-4S dicluster domain-containing protein [Magnetococcales bacterium]|nr:4Fe-4S dicluster domain-containing protein [Magnetococcales bacterium]
MSDESLIFDVVIVGAGPAGLGAAIRLGQLARQHGQDISICLLEKGASIGAHILSGAVFDPIALTQLIPDWREKQAPIGQQVTQEQFLLLNASSSLKLPDPGFLNTDCHILSLGQMTLWLAQQAENLGVQIFCGFAASRLLYSEQGTVIGIETGEMGRGKEGEKNANYQPGIKIKARQTLLAEGCRGQLSGEVVRRYGLNAQAQPQQYALGIKELWQVDSSLHSPGSIVHTVGWPLDHDTYGGGFVYHQSQQQVAVGLVIGLDYRSNSLDPFERFQTFKSHPLLRPLFAGGMRIGFGARTLTEGGVQSLPKLSFPGGVLLGDAAGFMDVGRMKGSHMALHSGQLAAEAVFLLLFDHSKPETDLYTQAIQSSWIWRDLSRSRNLRPGFGWGLIPGLFQGAVDHWLLKGKAPWTLNHRRRSHRIKRFSTPNQGPAAESRFKGDGRLTFDQSSSLQLAGVFHQEDQPSHIISDHTGPEDNRFRRYCPADVFATVLSPSNCLHCKSCDIKDFDKRLSWVAPQGGEGPNYIGM